MSVRAVAALPLPISSAKITINEVVQTMILTKTPQGLTMRDPVPNPNPVVDHVVLGLARL
jgi:hypothetical protein